MERTESHAALLSETEAETRRQEIIQRLLILAKTVEGGSSENEMRWQEVKQLEKELLEINPIDSSHGGPEALPEERRFDRQRRESIRKLLEESENKKD